MAEQLRTTIIAGKYRLLSVLGRGAMGEVYRAEQLDVEGHALREVALKTIRPDHVSDRNFARRFLREVRVSTRLRSPHTVTVYDVGQGEDGQLFFSMELIEGPTLRELLHTHGSLPLERAVHLTQQICLALSEAHGLPEPIIHRDLKPANIFVEQQYGHDWVKVGDFGIAKVLGEETGGLTQTTMSPGTPRYMAPEQWKGKVLDGRTDLYAVGIMLYEMLHGQSPFHVDGEPTSLMYKHLEEPPPHLPLTVPVGIRHVVERLLAKEPAERLPDALSVNAALESSLAASLRLADESTFVLIRDERPRPEPKPLLVQDEQNEQPESSQDVPLQPAPRPQHRAKNKRLPRFLQFPRFSRFLLVGVGLLGLLLVLGGIGYLLPPPPQEATFRPPVETAQPTEQAALVQEPVAQKKEKQQYTHMVQIPAGPFWMGCQSEVDKNCQDDEKPGRQVHLDTFWIDTYEVTVTEYRQCMEAGECPQQNLTKHENCNWNRSDRANHPINCVDWNQARRYCEWSGKRLPTEAEWEKAARGVEGWIYPWGSTWDASRVNAAEGKLDRTAPVGSYPSGVSPYQVHDMAGNVWEWVHDWYTPDYYQNGPAQNPSGQGQGKRRSVRGSSWLDDQWGARVATRNRLTPNVASDALGFRCARS